ncbi:mannose-6-phosphate isomerase, class I [Agromyces sp. SYSU K20354]|uniref:mannose-6-phosphate isomerase, class I n=1 Tax=Agromyces cavernae TaxID=2898659 RepID=UPI001E5670DC|nr:mannose-6-phosphate isomerase, class I [Agromyces cavernae]MCD2444041.1 mannose-6-phosphate isomerase, class I [Agromyces cavernae]
MFVAIDNAPRDYAWGSRDAIAEYRGVAPSGGPEAELWLGAHAGSPAKIIDATSVGHPDLATWIVADPTTALGTRLADERRLPFLLKVLAAAEPLSLQAHPTPQQARAGFEREEAEGVPIGAYDRNYKDPFHKPELIVAVSETFDALSGFRPFDEVRGIQAVLRAADAASTTPEPGALDLLDAHLAGDDPLRTTVEWLLRDGRGEDTGEAAWVTERIVTLAATETARDSEFALSFETVGRLSEFYPGDTGIVISLLLNRVRLNRGEALYLAAGNIHAYLEGLGIELMAASDNVLRGGLTPKHVDVGELLEVLDFTPIDPPYLAASTVAPGVSAYRPDVPDFALHRVEPAAASKHEAQMSISAPAIVLVEQGSISIRSGKGAASLEQGDAVYITPDESELVFGGTGVAWLATMNARG